MNNEQLKLVSSIQYHLESFSHPDSYRVAKEICEFVEFDKRKAESISNRLENGEPWEYVRGWIEFDTNILKVTKDTLIPRIETLQILDICDSCITPEIKRIYDIGTGSGAIAISLSKRHPDLEIVALDISQRALDIAKKNADTNAQKNIQFKHSNLLEGIIIPQPSIIVANLPYIPTNDYLNLDSSVKDHEPRIALDGGKEGLDQILKLLEQVKDNMNVKAVILEIDPEQTKILDVLDLGFSKEFIKDFRGLFRFLKLYR